MTAIDSHFKFAAERIAKADAIVIAAGAGIGVDSGLPDFRGNDGFWNAYPASAKAQINFTEIANPGVFHQQPELAWGFYGRRLDLYRKTVPHAGFDILKKWADAKTGSWVFTSNVDGQFQKAGFAKQQIHECHGSIHTREFDVPSQRDIGIPLGSREALMGIDDALATLPAEMDLDFT
jgi:NAD-dependent SIR2 family protein deacetylase